MGKKLSHINGFFCMQNGMNYYYMYRFIFGTCDVFVEIVKTEIPEE